jgi:DnaJ family protein C protein 17
MLAEEERIKEEGRQMIELAQKRALAQSHSASVHAQAAHTPVPGPSRDSHRHSSINGSSHSDSLPTPTASWSRSTQSPPQPPISPIDLTIIFTLPPHSSTSPLPTSTELEQSLKARYGPISHVLLREPPDAPNLSVSSEDDPKKKKKKKAPGAVVEFMSGNWGGCWACFTDKTKEGVKVRWAGKEQPAWVAWAEAAGGSKHKPHANVNGAGASANGVAKPNVTNDPPTPPISFSFTPTVPAAAPAPSFDSAPDFGQTTMADLLAQHSRAKEDRVEQKRKDDEYESMTLFNMRRLERERLAEEIRRQEGD